jgi:hypothetical protein
MQERLVPSGLIAFVRLPSGDEATLVWDNHVNAIERVETVAREAGYLGAFRVCLGSTAVGSRAALVEQFQALLPSLKTVFAKDRN